MDYFQIQNFKVLNLIQETWINLVMPFFGKLFSNNLFEISPSSELKLLWKSLYIVQTKKGWLKSLNQLKKQYTKMCWNTRKTRHTHSSKRTQTSLRANWKESPSCRARKGKLGKRKRRGRNRTQTTWKGERRKIATKIKTWINWTARSCGQIRVCVCE